MKIHDLISIGIQELNRNQIEDSGIKVRELLQSILEKDRSYLIANDNEEVRECDETRYKQCIQELLQGKPLQYIIHKQEFMGLDFYVDENVLIPQPDTETLVEEVISEIQEYVKKREIKQNETIRILDLCTGSGAIAISLAKYIRENVIAKNPKMHFEIVAVDISKNALEIAKKNAKKHDVEIKWIESDMFEKIVCEKDSEDDSKQNNKFDFIVSNPPYIETEVIETLSEEVKQEPHLALDGGKDGLDFYRTIAKESYQYLKKKRNAFR